MYEKELIECLDNMLVSLGDNQDSRLDAISDDNFINSIKESEKNLDEEYFKIDQIKLESLQDAIHEKIVYI